jgi:hypothetical protein
MFFEFRKLRIYENSYGVWTSEVMKWRVKTKPSIDDDTRGETQENPGVKSTDESQA